MKPADLTKILEKTPVLCKNPLAPKGKKHYNKNIIAQVRVKRKDLKMDLCGRRISQ